MKIGIVGTGAIAQRHLAALNTLAPLAELVGHVATTQHKADIAATRWGGRGFATIEELVVEGCPDAVFITAPPAQHGAIELDLIRDGIAFLVEKPLSADAATAERIGEALSGGRLVTAVGYQWRALDTMPGVRRFLAAHPPRMVLGSFHVGMPTTSWWRRQNESGGQMVEQACHLIDLARHLLGDATVEAAVANSRPSAAFPDADIATASAALVKFQGSVPGLFSATCLSPNAKSVELRIVCDDAHVTITLAGATFQRGNRAEHLPVVDNPYVRQDRAFLEAVASGAAGDVFCSYEDALATHRLCHAITRFEPSIAGAASRQREQPQP